MREESSSNLGSTINKPKLSFRIKPSHSECFREVIAEQSMLVLSSDGCLWKSYRNRWEDADGHPGSQKQRSEAAHLRRLSKGHQQSACSLPLSRTAHSHLLLWGCFCVLINYFHMIKTCTNTNTSTKTFGMQNMSLTAGDHFLAFLYDRCYSRTWKTRQVETSKTCWWHWWPLLQSTTVMKWWEPSKSVFHYFLNQSPSEKMLLTPCGLSRGKTDAVFAGSWHRRRRLGGNLFLSV